MVDAPYTGPNLGPLQGTGSAAPVPVTPSPVAPPAPQQMNIGQPAVQPDVEPLVIDDPNASPPSSPDTMDDRASKFKYGLGDLLGKTRDEIYQNLQDGRENELRESAASTIDQRKQGAIQQLIAQTTANKEGPLSPEETGGLIQAVQEMQANTDPTTVLETAYGKQFMATLDRTAEGNDDNILSDAQKQAPEETAAILQQKSTLATKSAIINTMLQDATDRAKAQGWLGWGYDKAKEMIPGYTEVQQRGNVPGVGVFQGGSLGANLLAQRTKLLQLPPDEMAAKLKEIVDPWFQHNPSEAVDFLQSMKGMSTADVFLKNMDLPMQVIGLVGGGKAGSAVKVGVLGEKQAVFDVRKAANDMVKAAGMPDASKSTAEAAAGDLAESAVTRATTNAVQDIQNVPQATRRAVESLTETFRADLEAVRTNPGTKGQDIVNRIEERANAIQDQLITTATNIQKNERLPEVLSNESAVRLITEDMEDKYVGLRNSIIDTSKIYREPLSNTYLMDFFIGKNDGTYFPQRSVAENFAKFQGLADAGIEELSGPTVPKSIAQANKLTSQIKVSQGIIDRETERLADTTRSEKQHAYSRDQIQASEEFLVNKAMERRALPQTTSIEQQGLGYYVKITKPIDETRPAIRQAIAQTTNTKIPDSPITFFLNNWVGKYAGAALAKYRTPEDVLSLAERQNRLTTTYAPTGYFQILKDNAKEIQALSANRFSKNRKRWEEWQQGLENAQELPDSVDPTRKGYFFQSPAEMETHWQQWFHRLPDDQEIAAYFEFKRGMEIDRVFRNIAEHRNQQRVGSETHNIIGTDASGKQIKSPDFNGVVRDKIPGSADNIAVFSDKIGEEKLIALDKTATKRKTEFQKDIDRGGYKLIELYAPENRPLSGFGNITDERIRYVLVSQVETRALDWNHIPRRGGGHIQYDYDFYIKQPNIKYDSIGDRHWYEGDTTIMASPTQGIGRGVATHLNEIRKLLKEKNEVAAREYSNKNMHVDWDTVLTWFKGKKDDTGKYQPPSLNLNEDIQVIPKNKQTIDLDDSIRKKYADFRNGTREGSLARQNQVEFSQGRDAHELLAVDVEGTKANPLYKVSPASKVDAVTTMNRGLQRIANSNFMDDYKTMAVEHWLAQAAPYLDAKSRAEIYNSPYYFFNEGKFFSGTPADVRLRLEASKYHTQQLTGQPSLTDALLHSAAQKLADSAFSAFGPKGLVLTPTWLLPKLRDPFGFIRSVAFDTKLGLFNIPQFIVQSANYSNILGIAGYKYAGSGTLAAQLHFWSTVNSHPSIISHLDKLASNFNLPGTSKWKPGEFTEAFQEMNNTGFGHPAGEVASLDNLGNKVISTAKDTFLDWGRMPFQQGEKNSRYGAWYTAYREFRDANPTGRISNNDRAAILQRADLLNINMSRASSSAIHKGIFSIPTQFYTYQIRLTELMLGNRLTAAEKTRLFATNAALYGVPMAAGVTSLPAADWLREKALDNGYVVGDDYWTSMLMEGVPAALTAVATGGGDPSKGTWYDIGPRFGTKGLEFLGNLSSSDANKGFLDVMGGPAYSITKNTIAASSGLARSMISLARQDGDVFPQVTEDWTDVVREISSVNSTFRIIAAINYGRAVSKKDAYLADTTPAQAIFGAAFGIKDVNIDDINIKNNSLKSQTEYEKAVEDRFRIEFRRGVLAQQDNPELAKKFFTRAQAWLTIGGYREDRINSLVGKALSDNQSMIDKTNWDFYLRKAPDAQKDVRMKAFQKTMQLQDQKKSDDPAPSNPTGNTK